MQKERDEKATNAHRQTQAMVCVYTNNDAHSDNELSKSKQSIDADMDKIVVENKHFKMVRKTVNKNAILNEYLYESCTNLVCKVQQKLYLLGN